MKQANLWATVANAVVASVFAVDAAAQNPIICDRYTPDPAPMVHNDTLYLFVGHDADVTQNNYFTMPNWLLYSTVDMVNWTYRGTPVTTATFKTWAKQDNDAWASQCIERNGKWYWYCTATVKNGGYPGVGVAVADNPAGPYRDLIRKPIVSGWGTIDPTVFIDDDDKAYLFWGNNGLKYARLRSNMITLSGNAIEVNTLDEKAFGPYKGYDDNGKPKTNYEEAPWIYKIGDTYYLEYAAGGVPEHWAYSTAKNIAGPWTYRGRVMDEPENSFTIHGGSIDFKGHSYMFYHNGKLPNGGGFRRSTCVEEFTRNADGSIPKIKFTRNGVTPLEAMNPYERQEAETINQSSGILCDGDGEVNFVTNIKSTSYIKVRNVDFGSEPATRFMARMASAGSGTVCVRLDKKEGRVVARLRVSSTGGLDVWQDFETEMLSSVTGVHDVFFTFVGTGSAATLFNFDSWQFSTATSGISSTEAESSSRNADAYSLSGAKLSGTTSIGHGIVVTKGRKYLRKR